MKVKGKDDPLSNFYECQSRIHAFNTSFKSVEHALQYKKLFDHDMLHEAEEIQNMTEPSDAKTVATSEPPKLELGEAVRGHNAPITGEKESGLPQVYGLPETQKLFHDNASQNTSTNPKIASDNR